MYTFSSLRLLLCLMIFAAHFHCVMAHGAALVREVAEARCEEVPIGETGTCENESGCICKGALVSDSFPALLVDSQPTDGQSATVPAVFRVDVAGCESDWRNTPRAAAPPLGGTGARILLQSFQL
jgi:hypothetical protein